MASVLDERVMFCFFLFFFCSGFALADVPADCQMSAPRGVKARAYGSMSHSAQPSCSCCFSHREALSTLHQKQPVTTVYRLPPQA